MGYSQASVSLELGRIDQLADRIASSAATIDAATHGLLTAIREFDNLGGWHRQGAVSCAQWLSWRIGLGPGVAREKVRVANALADLPLTDAALSRGEISYSKVRAISRVATADDEAQLLDMARHSTASQLEKICRLFRQCQSRAEGRARDEEDRRWVSSRSTDDGMVRITMQLRPDEAAQVMLAIDVSAETSNRADGVAAMAEATLRGTAAERSPTEVVVNIDAGSLTGQLSDGHGVSAETCKRLLCDAGIIPAMTDANGAVLNLGRKRRTVSAALRRALRLRDQGCGFPGCTHARWLHAHHIEHWAHGGETSLENTVLLCSTHHRYVHEYAFDVRRNSEGELAFFDADGRGIAADLSRAKPRPLQPIAAEVNAPLWNGRTANYQRCVESLLH